MAYNGREKEERLSKAFAKIMRYCAYRERCRSEVREKMGKIGLISEDAKVLLTRLEEEGFINEERYACMFALGKFRLKKWGKVKIRAALQGKKITETDIERGLQEIDAGAYGEVLDNLLERKLKAVSEQDPYVKNEKAARFVISKGYEPQLVWEKLKALSH